MQSLHLYETPSDKRIEGSLGAARNKTEICPPKSYRRECVEIQRIYYSSLYTVPCVINPLFPLDAVSYLKARGTVASLTTSGNEKTYGYPRFSTTFHNDTTGKGVTKQSQPLIVSSAILTSRLTDFLSMRICRFPNRVEKLPKESGMDTHRAAGYSIRLAML